MTLHLGMANEGSDTGDKSWARVCDVSAKIRCPCDSGVGLCVQLCIYAFGIVRIVVYDVGGCHMSVVIDPGEINCFCSCVMIFMMFLVYFQDNNQDIITRTTVSKNAQKLEKVFLSFFDCLMIDLKKKDNIKIY